MEIKITHEQACFGQEWAADSLLEHYSSLLASQEAGDRSEATGAPPPRLVIEHAEKNSFNVRIWEVEDAAEESIGPNADQFLLSEFATALYEDGVQGIRLLLSEAHDDAGRPVIRDARWYDSDELAAYYEDDL